MNKAVFLDRDGTINVQNSFEPNCSKPADLILLPMVAEGIRLLNECGYKIIVITNQPWIEDGYFDDSMLKLIHNKMEMELAVGSAKLDAIYYCPHSKNSNCDCRKPKPKLSIEAIKKFGIDVNKSYMIGDWWRDIELGRAIGARTILVGNYAKERNVFPEPDFYAPALYDAAKLIISEDRCVR